MKTVCRTGEIGLRSFVFLAALAVFAMPRTAAAQVVSTLAGSGAPGFADGRGAAATFLFPAAVAVDGHGTTYVADAAAQRIRVVTADGAVRTLAGSGELSASGAWVEGGNRDGGGAGALFDVPLGIAVAQDGSIDVADSANRSIRRVAPDGTVTTLARGLGRPHQLAFDRSGRLYVADTQRGILRIDPSGTVSVLQLDVNAPYGIAIFESGGSMALFVADGWGILRAEDGHEIRIGPNERAVTFDGNESGVAAIATSNDSARPITDATEGGDSIGTPYQLAALDAYSVAYTDVRNDAVRLLTFDPAAVAFRAEPRTPGSSTKATIGASVTLLAGSATAGSGGIGRGGGFENGSTARFAAPMGIARAPSGALIVADAGNRRIRRIAEIERRPLVSNGALPPPRDASGAYRILYAGASTVWWDTSWHDSIPGTIERDLTGGAHAPHAFEVYPDRILGARLGGFASYLGDVADAGLVDAVVLDLNGGSAEGFDDAGTWVAPATAQLRAIRERLDRAHIAFVVVVAPLPLQLDPVEQTWRKVVEDALRPVLRDDEARWLEAIHRADVHAVDLWPVFRADMRSPARQPLFGTDESHYTPHGRAVAAHAISAALLQLRQWDRTPH